MNTVVRHLQVSGRVQGVGYRWAMVGAAQRLGVQGWVRNRRDGSVEALLAGSPGAVQALIEWARHGPATAAVERVEVTEQEAGEGEGGFATFESRPTA